MSTSRTTRGFSTLELVAVLAIILLIMLIAWPSLQARRKAMLGAELGRAMNEGDRGTAIKLLKRGAPPDAWSGAHPHYCVYCKAIQKRDEELLLSAIGSVGITNDSIRFHCPPLLVIALERHDTAMVELLLELGSTATQRFQCQEFTYPNRYVRLSPLAAAIEMNDAVLVNLLLSHASPTDLQKPGHPNGPLANDSALLHSAVRSGNPEWVKLLLERGVPIDALERLGETALHEAARLGSREMVEVLLAHGANPDTKDESGARPIDKAPARFHAELAALLGEISRPSAVD